jgi:hypothetical protein
VRQVARVCVGVERVKAGLRVVHVAAGSPPGWLPGIQAMRLQAIGTQAAAREGMECNNHRSNHFNPADAQPVLRPGHSTPAQLRRTRPPQAAASHLKVASTTSSSPSPSTSPKTAFWCTWLLRCVSQTSLPAAVKAATLPRASAATSSSCPSALMSATATCACKAGSRQGGLGKEGETRQARRQASTGLQQLLLRPPMCAPTQPTTHSPHTAKTSDHPTPSHL